jgi:hypothetical protein
LRLRFEFTPEKVDLEDVRRVEMVAPGSPGDLPAEQSRAVWVELRDSADNVLTHRLLRDPFGLIAERHRGDGLIDRFDADQRGSGRFEVLMSDTPGATKVVLWTPDAAGARAKRRDFDLA